MKNRTLAISRGCIPYIKELRNIAGSVTASILMQQLDYWFSKQDGEPFYKFKAPCENEYYKSGDSFTEELGFSIEEFTNAFAKIGFSYKSKTEFENATDKFQGMFYCSYFDRKEGLTFYFRNHELLDTTLNELFTVKLESPFTENGKVHLQKTGKSISPIYITEEYNNRLQQKKDTASGFSESENPTVKDSLTVQKPKKEIQITKKEDIESFVRKFKATEFEVDGVVNRQSIFTEGEIVLIVEYFLRRKEKHKSKASCSHQAIKSILNQILEIKGTHSLEVVFEQRDGCYVNCGTAGDPTKPWIKLEPQYFEKLIKKPTFNNQYVKPKLSMSESADFIRQMAQYTKEQQEKLNPVNPEKYDYPF